MNIWMLIALLALAPIAMAQNAEEEADAQVPPLLDHEVTRIDGESVSLADYQGKVLLIFNAASKCGHTKQYAALQDLHEKYAEQGLAVLGFPANNFGNQEPGTNLQIIQFCEENYGVTFDMFEKVSVKGEDQHPLFAALTAAEAEPAGTGEIKWNFEKFLIGRDGELVGRFRSKVQPGSEAMIEAIEAALAAE